MDFSEQLDQLKQRIHQLWADWLALAERRPRLVRSLLIGFGIVAAVTIIPTVWYVINLQRGLPDKEAIARIGEMDEATGGYDDHEPPVFSIFKQQRIGASLSDVSPHLIHAILAIEDQRFYDHGGLDISRTAAAAIANLRHRRTLQGGSTITQQLARQSFLTADKTIRRKLQELILAERIERFYTKPQILELYLNKVYFGDGLYGVEAAARGYFGTHASELSVAEAATLAGLVQAPAPPAPARPSPRAAAPRQTLPP